MTATIGNSSDLFTFLNDDTNSIGNLTANFEYVSTSGSTLTIDKEIRLGDHVLTINSDSKIALGEYTLKISHTTLGSAANLILKDYNIEQTDTGKLEVEKIYIDLNNTEFKTFVMINMKVTDCRVKSTTNTGATGNLIEINSKVDDNGTITYGDININGLDIYLGNSSLKSVINIISIDEDKFAFTGVNYKKLSEEDVVIPSKVGLLITHSTVEKNIINVGNLDMLDSNGVDFTNQYVSWLDTNYVNGDAFVSDKYIAVSVTGDKDIDESYGIYIGGDYIHDNNSDNMKEIDGTREIELFPGVKKTSSSNATKMIMTINVKDNNLYDVDEMNELFLVDREDSSGVLVKTGLNGLLGYFVNNVDDTPLKTVNNYNSNSSTKYVINYDWRSERGHNFFMGETDMALEFSFDGNFAELIAPKNIEYQLVDEFIPNFSFMIDTSDAVKDVLVDTEITRNVLNKTTMLVPSGEVYNLEFFEDIPVTLTVDCSGTVDGSGAPIDADILKNLIEVKKVVDSSGWTLFLDDGSGSFNFDTNDTSGATLFELRVHPANAEIKNDINNIKLVYNVGKTGEYTKYSKTETLDISCEDVTYVQLYTYDGSGYIPYAPDASLNLSSQTPLFYYNSGSPAKSYTYMEQVFYLKLDLKPYNDDNRAIQDFKYKFDISGAEQYRFEFFKDSSSFAVLSDHDSMISRTKQTDYETMDASGSFDTKTKFTMRMYFFGDVSGSEFGFSSEKKNRFPELKITVADAQYINSNGVYSTFDENKITFNTTVPDLVFASFDNGSSFLELEDKKTFYFDEDFTSSENIRFAIPYILTGLGKVDIGVTLSPELPHPGLYNTDNIIPTISTITFNASSSVGLNGLIYEPVTIVGAHEENVVMGDRKYSFTFAPEDPYTMYGNAKIVLKEVDVRGFVFTIEDVPFSVLDTNKNTYTDADQDTSGYANDISGVTTQGSNDYYIKASTPTFSRTNISGYTFEETDTAMFKPFNILESIKLTIGLNSVPVPVINDVSGSLGVTLTFENGARILNSEGTNVGQTVAGNTTVNVIFNSDSSGAAQTFYISLDDVSGEDVEGDSLHKKTSVYLKVVGSAFDDISKPDYLSWHYGDEAKGIELFVIKYQDAIADEIYGHTLNLGTWRFTIGDSGKLYLEYRTNDASATGDPGIKWISKQNWEKTPPE